MEAVKNRSPYWDNIKGILIVLTVFAHILYQHQYNGDINNICDYIYMFHMPVFVFVSGYFGKSERSCSMMSIAKLAMLYFIFNSFMWFIYDTGSIIEPAYSYWYLLALIFWRLTARYIAKFKEIMLVLFGVSLFAGFFSSVDNTLAIARIIGFYPFYMAGYLLSEDKADTAVSEKYSRRFLKGAVFLAAAAVIAFFAENYFEYSDSSLQMFPYSTPLDAFGRIVLYIIAFLMIMFFRYVCVDKEIPLITMFGRNSLWIFIFHRPFTLIISDLIKPSYSVYLTILLSVAATAVICLVFGNGLLVRYFDLFANSAAGILTGAKGKRLADIAARAAVICAALLYIVSVVTDAYRGFSFTPQDEDTSQEITDTDIIYPVMSGEQKTDFDNAFRITFAGDLILLEDQVKRGYIQNGYDFSPVFEYAEKYILSADYAIGVFEGPMAGEEAGYSTSNFDDGKELALNFPDEFAQAVKDAGFDLVTTANNHVLDKGADGALRTLDVLDKTGLDHTGSYRSEEEKENSHVKIVEAEGIKFAVLSYTYGSNGMTENELINGKYSFVTSVLPESGSECFEQSKEQVKADFEKAKSFDPDVIIVLPHMGTQFSNAPDEMQQTWFSIFKECGADIILGDHAHSVQPAVIEEYSGKNVFTAYCPGNFANIYREYQGDTSMLVDVYIDRTSKSVIGGSIVPLYTCSSADGNFRALPVYDIMTDSELRKQLSTDDLERADAANEIITKVVFGHAMDITSVSERYYFTKDGFVRSKATGLVLDDDMKNGVLYTEMEKADTICFIGDSVTEGTKNGGCPWYEPIEEYFKNKKIENFSLGGVTVSYMTERADEIPAADLYVIAIGTNDVRYRDEKTCTMTAESYAEEITKLHDKLLQKAPQARFVFIAPWYSTDGDNVSELSFAEKTALNEEYSAALKSVCQTLGCDYINANPYIKNMLDKNIQSKYLLDHIHPNIINGVVMYS